MDDKKLNKIEVNKIWDAMIEAEIITKPADRKEAKKQYNIKDELKTTNNYKIQLLKKTILFFYDKYHGVRKIFYEKLNNKENVIKELNADIKRLQRENASLLSNEKYYKDLLNESRDEADKYKRANKKLQNEECLQGPQGAPDKIDFYGPAISCIVKAEAVSSDED